MEDLDKEGKAQNSHNWTEDHMGGKVGTVRAWIIVLEL